VTDNRTLEASSSVKVVLQQAQAWAARATAAGWLTPAQAASLSALSGDSSTDLFDESAGEPLVVALFGGTGVGKSSLLNRLVGAKIAEVGVIRPTSLEATLYVHEAVEFSGPPLRRFQRASHNNDTGRYVVWVDMPDIDSTAKSNRDLVLEFLPFVDVLIYVVSPERYRDEAPWALLRQYADRSAWVFVMNQFDRGNIAQLDDLGVVLGQAGFAEPVLFATSCTSEIANDGFADLAGLIEELAAERLRRIIKNAGSSARRRQLQAQLAATGNGWPESGVQLNAAWRRAHTAFSVELSEDLVARLAPVAARLADAEVVAPGELWDDWASERFNDALTQTRLEARESGWPGPLLDAFDELNDAGLAAHAERLLRESVRTSLVRPGSALQRGVHAVCSKLIFGLPLFALGWIGWFVLRGFYEGATGAGSFVADGCAVNALLLVGLAAGLPYLPARLTQPSPKRAALLGIRRGLDQLLGEFDAKAVGVIDKLAIDLKAVQAQRGAMLELLTADTPVEHTGLTRRLRGVESIPQS